MTPFSLISVAAGLILSLSSFTTLTEQKKKEDKGTYKTEEYDGHTYIRYGTSAITHSPDCICSQRKLVRRSKPIPIFKTDEKAKQLMKDINRISNDRVAKRKLADSLSQNHFKLE